MQRQIDPHRLVIVYYYKLSDQNPYRRESVQHDQDVYTRSGTPFIETTVLYRSSGSQVIRIMQSRRITENLAANHRTG